MVPLLVMVPELVVKATLATLVKMILNVVLVD
jgi:hypothetical protein